MIDWQRIWNDDGNVSCFSPVKAIAYTLSLLYRLIINSRNWLYNQQVLKEVKLSCPVISIGNITVGGTGKTPCVIMLAQMLQKRGFKPAVLSRGYGSKGSQPVNIVSDGNNILLSGKTGGDEPLLIAQSLPGIPVITGLRRILTGQTAINKLGADVLLCDDAFQHRQIFRDINIVLLDSRYPLGNGHILPRGSLREPISSLSRASAIILTRCNDSSDSNNFIDKEALFKGIPIFRSRHKAKDIIMGNYTNPLPLSLLKEKKVCAFAGIAQPQSFRNTLREAEAQIVSFDIFPDHHRYNRKELDQIKNNFLENNADFLITTEKDGMRLHNFKDILDKIHLLRIEMEILPDKILLEDFILRKLSAAGQSQI